MQCFGRHGQKVIVIDLNPLSRSAQQGSITIVDELSRALNTMLAIASEEGKLAVDASYDHQAVLNEGLKRMLSGLKKTIAKCTHWRRGLTKTLVVHKEWFIRERPVVWVIT